MKKSVPSAHTGVSLRSEEGVYILLFALALVTIFLVIGLGVDGGRMFLRGLNQQRSADAGALAGARLLGRIPDNQVREIAQRVARDNYELNTVAYNAGALDTHFEVPPIVDAQVRVITSSDMRTYISGQIVPGRDQVNVRAQASATRIFPAVILVIDNTGSMGQVTARDPQGQIIRDQNGNAMTKLDVAKAAAKNFVRQFSNHDRVGIANYATSSAVGRSISFAYDQAALFQAIDNIPVIPNATNIQIGLLRALRDMENWLNSDPGLRAEWPNRFIILMTDGSPNQNSPDDNQDRDLLNNWFEEDGPDADSLPDPKPYPSFPTSPNCRQQNGAADRIVEKENYVHAQIAANFIRSFGHTVLTVAIGEINPDPNLRPTAQYPYGLASPWGNGYIIPSFMRYLANDWDGSQEQTTPDHPFYPECVPSYESLHTSGYGQGLSLISNNIADIDGMFQAMAAYISLRLTS